MQRGKATNQGAAKAAGEPPAQSEFARRLQSGWVLVAILVVAALFRFWNLDQPKMSADESLHYFPEMQAIHQLPFSQQRIHPTDLYHATSPNPSGHPLFAVQVANIVMQSIAATAAVGRGVMAAAGVAMVGVIYLLGRDLFDRRYGLMAAAMAAILPEAVRFNRTLYLDSIYALLVTLLVWLLVRTFTSQSPKWYLLAGLVLGLAGATKTSAPTLVPLVILYGAFWWWQTRTEPELPARKERKRSRSRSHFVFPVWAKVVVIMLLGFVVFTIFVDPSSYFEAIRNPVDSSYRNTPMSSYPSVVWRSRAWFLSALTYLWTPPLIIAAAAGLILMIRHEWRKPSHILVLMILWLGSLVPLLPLHSPGLSGEHGHLPFVAPVTLLASYALMQLQRLWMTIAFVVILLTMLPATILFGHRLMLLPYNSYLNVVDSEAHSPRPDPFPSAPEVALRYE